MIAWMMPEDEGLALQLNDMNRIAVIPYSALRTLFGMTDTQWRITAVDLDESLEKPLISCVWGEGTRLTLALDVVIAHGIPAECHAIEHISIPVGVDYGLEVMLRGKELSIPDAIHQLVLDLYWNDPTIGGLACSHKGG
jgi:hypothetical protein